MSASDREVADALAEAFERAWRRAPPVSARVRIAGRPVHFRIAGENLARETLRPFAHLGGQNRPGEDDAALSIDVWDEAATGVPSPVRVDEGPDGARHWASGGGVFTASADARYLGFRHSGSISLYDRAARRITGCRARGSEFSSNARVKPFAIHLVPWLSGEGVHEVHAALVGRAGAGVLLAGASGAGKSTSAMACVRHGLDFLGDDIVGLEPRLEGTCVGHSLFGGVSLSAADVDRFGVPAVHLDHAVRVAEKQCLFPVELGHGRARASADVVAVLLLRAGAPRTELEAAKRSEVLVNVAKNALWTVVPRPGAAAMAAIARLAEDVPGYWLHLGADPNDTPIVVEQLLGRLAVR